MASSSAKTVAAYLDELPEERRKVISKVRAHVRKRLPKGYDETMAFGMINYIVPKSVVPETYNGQPLCYAAIAAQKNHFAVYLMNAYVGTPVGTKLAAEFKAAGKKLDMGKSCVRFKSLDDISLDAIGNAIAATPVDAYVALYEQARLQTKTGAKKAAAKKRNA